MLSALFEIKKVKRCKACKSFLLLEKVFTNEKVDAFYNSVK